MIRSRPSSSNTPAKIGSLVLALSLILPEIGYASRLKIVVSGADFRPFPIAAPSAVVEGAGKSLASKLARDVSRTVQGSIDLLRILELVPPKSYIAPKGEPWNAPTYANWVNVGASGLIRAHVTAKGKGEELKLALRFYDVLSQRELLHRTYSCSKDDTRPAIHRFVDAVVELLTGEKGILSSRLVFAKRTKDGKAIFVSDIDGERMTRVTDTDQLSLLPAWGRRGRHVLFTSYTKDNPDLYRVELKSGRVEWLSKKRGLNTGAAVSPDGKSIALTLSVDGNTEIYVMGWDGKNLKRLTDNWGQDISATWSPDGKRIAFVSSRSGQPHIYVMNADGSNQRRLTFQGTYNQEPSWSPREDGQIAFTARDETLMYDMFLVHPDTGKLTRLTQDEGVRNEHPSFSPDGQQIVFTSTRPPGRGKKLYVMDVDGRNQRRISRGAGEYETPRWGPWQGYD